ncbi:AraC family transcriptional regulator [Aquimarina sp. 2201CG5-10]|uniref:helix-turn-helix transcriptional regulator n=1 Tax=Aquimarina callyspongiae TaxID=3098150 RepID=UPI002AB41DBB|nr:AraC family transcriptional regulator [Aquimarina sp. 2201CG5-10]MDY8135974.1 AraC family transcriptional regulator [Aquimarina sp. 2201CG5-10]
MECATIYYDKKHYFPMHLHPDRYTFSYIINGSANLICNNSIFILKPGSLVIIPPYVAHQTLVEHFFHYKVIRVPKLHAFVNLNATQLGLTIIKNNHAYKNQFNKWFDKIKANNNEEIIIPEVFEHFLMSHDADLTKPKILLKKALIHLESNYYRPIPVEELSDLIHLSESHFQRLFKANIGISASRYLQNLRIEKAKEYIKTRNCFTDIAYDTGFFDQSHFNKYFKINVGMIPKRYADLVKND